MVTLPARREMARQAIAKLLERRKFFREQIFFLMRMRHKIVSELGSALHNVVPNGFRGDLGKQRHEMHWKDIELILQEAFGNEFPQLSQRAFKTNILEIQAQLQFPDLDAAVRDQLGDIHCVAPPFGLSPFPDVEVVKGQIEFSLNVLRVNVQHRGH